jgi:hypothetical protein
MRRERHPRKERLRRLFPTPRREGKDAHAFRDAIGGKAISGFRLGARV